MMRKGEKTLSMLSIFGMRPILNSQSVVTDGWTDLLIHLLTPV